jgi:hypothetical protein
MKRVLPVLLLAALAAACAGPQVRITPGAEKIDVEINGRPFTTFYVAGPEVTKPYLHPLRAASGTHVTRMWPMEDVAEEENTAKDHMHQRGLWFGHDGVNGVNFWANEVSFTPPNLGRIVLVGAAQVESGRERGSISATFEWRSPEGRPMVKESRVMTFYAEPSQRTIDFDITLTALDKTEFGDQKDGVFGIRLRPVLQEDSGSGRILNAEGLETEEQAWGKPSIWCDYSGEIHGEKVGVTILDHPGNPRHPVRWHVRGYGLFSANAFGESVFTGDASRTGGITVEAGDSLRFRYRVIIHPGEGDRAGIGEMWTQYASGK